MEGGEGSGRGGAELPLPAVLQSIALLEQARRCLTGASTWSLSDGELREGVAEIFRQLQGLNAGWLGLVRELDARPDAVPGARPGEVARTFLVHRLRQTSAQAGRDVRAAKAIDPDGGQLPELGAAFVAGEISRAHVDVAVAAGNAIPRRMLEHVDEDGVRGSTKVDQALVSHARVYDPRSAQRLAGHLLAVLDPSGRDRFDPDAFTRRRLWCANDSTGMLVGSFQLAPADGAVFKAAVDALSGPAAATAAQTQDGQQVLVIDERSPEQRRADALPAMARIVLKHLGDTTPGGPATHVSVIASADQVVAARQLRPGRPAPSAAEPAPRPSTQTEGAGPPGTRSPGIDDAAAEGASAPGREPCPAPGPADCLQTGDVTIPTLGRLACDAVLQAVFTTPSGAVLDLGRAVRTVTVAQRRALVARDRGCVIPGCAAPMAACEAHHVRWWRHGGRSDLTNLALLCGHHHTAVHAGIWAITMIDGVPWAIPPPWVSPEQHPIRSGLLDARAHTERLGHQLRLPVADPPHHGYG